MIDLTQLRPLDVILTRDRYSVVSRSIAKATRGKFSHAALVISPLVKFESVAKGIGFTAQRPRFVRVPTESEPPKLFGSILKYAKFRVYRHPEVASLTSHEANRLQSRVLDITGRFCLLSYPSLRSFLGPIEHLGLSQVYHKLCSKLPRSHEFSGPFCSEMIATIYSDLGLSLFGGSRQAHTVTPSCISQSKLCPIALSSPGKLLMDWKELCMLQEFRRLIASFSAAKSGFRSRKKALRGMTHLLKEIYIQNPNLSDEVSIDQIPDGATHAINAVCRNLLSFELQTVESILAGERALLAFSGDTELEFFPFPRQVYRSSRDLIPRSDSHLQPIVDHINLANISWSDLVEVHNHISTPRARAKEAVRMLKDFKKQW